MYRQNRGTAIETKFAPDFTNIFMDHWEKYFLSTCRFGPWVWFSFLDDVFIIWPHGPQELDSFLGALNSYHETVKFTWEISKKKISYLDVMVCLEDGKLSTDVCHKPIDAHQHLNFRSCHPLHVKKGIPHGQALRLKRICDSEDKFEKRLMDLKGFLVNRGYKEDLDDSQYRRVRKVGRSDLLCRNQKHSEDKKERMALILNYLPSLLKISRILRELQVLVECSPLLESILPEPPIVSFRRSRNIKVFWLKLK